MSKTTKKAPSVPLGSTHHDRIIRKMASEGLSSRDIATSLNVSRHFVNHRRRELGIVGKAGRPLGATNREPTREMTKAPASVCAALWRNGLSTAAIGKKLGVSQNTVARRVLQSLESIRNTKP